MGVSESSRELTLSLIRQLTLDYVSMIKQVEYGNATVEQQKDMNKLLDALLFHTNRYMVFGDG